MNHKITISLTELQHLQLSLIQAKRKAKNHQDALALLITEESKRLKHL